MKLIDILPEGTVTDLSKWKAARAPEPDPEEMDMFTAIRKGLVEPPPPGTLGQEREGPEVISSWDEDEPWTPASSRHEDPSDIGGGFKYHTEEAVKRAVAKLKQYRVEPTWRNVLDAMDVSQEEWDEYGVDPRMLGKWGVTPWSWRK